MKVDYCYLDLIELGRLAYNNLIKDESWIKKEDKQEQEKNYLALVTQLMSKFASGNYETDARKSVGRDRSNNRDNREKVPLAYLPWRYETPDNVASKDVRGTTMKWCRNDCHNRPTWCGRKNYINRAYYATAMQKKRDNKDSGNSSATPSDNSRPNVSKDFKIALAALTSAEDYASLEEQFFQLKE